jgi:hypothetical protein
MLSINGGVAIMTFEVYRPRGERQEKLPVISLSKTSIVLNNVAREKINSDRIELAYDPKKAIMRIKGVNEGGIQVKKTKVFGKGFFNQFKIDNRGKYNATYEPEENALFVQL